MLDNFKGINEAEKKQLICAISKITVLIAGADGVIDTAETEWATKLTKIRSYATEDELKDFYKEVSKTFDQDLNSLINAVPYGVDVRTKLLVEWMTELNTPLSKLPHELAAILYRSYTTFAKHVAEASGGFLRMWSISGEEKKLINLPMITPIISTKKDSL